MPGRGAKAPPDDYRAGLRYNFFVIGYSSTERPSDCIVTLASNAKGVGLSFYYGSTLPDPPASCKAVARRTGSFVSADRKRCGNRPSPR